ncbi:MAG: T9SS type A sorting domain-containing protein [Bacteroidales bacterium]|nr:T9SS type A sorting domain-containing protein [Bacteroidales bacterium]MBN2821035.1 T9SS type A sorting domain-containing protein [Bacteroidales bacterium]
MKYIFIVLLCLPVLKSFSQLTANAGFDTLILCIPQFYDTIGGTPTASGGTEPYIYSWEIVALNGSFDFDIEDYNNNILSDKQSANPVFNMEMGDFFNGFMTIELTVTDTESQTAVDSIVIAMSNISSSAMLVCSIIITESDSVQLYICNGLSKGIPPFTFHWEPEEYVSNPEIEEPWAYPIENTHFTVTIIDSVGCIARDYILAYFSNTNTLKQNDFIKFPNPVNQSSVLSFDSQLLGSQFVICNLQGMIVHNSTINSCEFVIGDVIDDPGIYICTIILDSGNIISGKLIIQ